ncbi:MAG: hypothetical protein U0105_11420 [Candidatus Obscuribacterales bacterium]
MASQDPRDEARKFLTIVGSGNVEKALGEFGDNTCHCAPKGGYTSYFQYESGVDPNIAFLLGQKFQVSSNIQGVRMADNQPFLLPWEKPETFAVDAQLVFDKKENAPYFLPMDTAFGEPIPEAELKKFLADPTEGAIRAFSLRVRPTLKPGFIPEFHAVTKEDVEAEKSAKEVLAPELLKYLHARDAGPVKLDDGKTVAMEEYGDQLPRLYSAVVRLYIVRRGQINRWTIKKVQLHDAILLTNKGERLQVLRTKAPTPADLETPGNNG